MFNANEVLTQDLGRLYRSVTDLDEPRLVSVTTHARRLNSTSTGVASFTTERTVTGFGVAETDVQAQKIASIELVERLAAESYRESLTVLRSASELGDQAIDLDTLPRCSSQELASPYSTLGVPDKDQPIRWTRGLSLISGNPVYIPTVMAYNSAGWKYPAENFWLPISTGCAAHVNYHQAIYHAIAEVIERDIISVLWLQQMSLPRIDLDCDVGVNRKLLNNGAITTTLFDATSDLRVPTVYGLQSSLHHPHAQMVCACATSFSYRTAVQKVLRDLTAIKRAYTEPRPVNNLPAAFTGVFEGATYMAQPEHAVAFDFLVKGTRSTSLSRLYRREEEPDLTKLVNTFDIYKMEVVAVDLTSDEALKSGLVVVRAIIPALQPLSFHNSAQFKAHRRLYELPVRMGYESKPEADLNPWPQPFA